MPNQLIEIVKAGDVATAQRLFAEGADVNARDETGVTLLMLAAHAGDLPMTKALIAAKTDCR